MSGVPVEALSRLNVHARSRGGGLWGNGVAHAIYAYKELAALVALTEESAALRFVKWQGRCARCTNGQYSHWDWDDGYTVRCRDCRGTGIRTLRFTETRFATGQVWHHPWEGRGHPHPGHSLADSVLGLTLFYADDHVGHGTDAGQVIEWRTAGTWAPSDHPADRLPLAELVPLLNQVEDWVESADSFPGFGSPWIRERAQRHLRTPKPTSSWCEGDPTQPGYSLDLGRMPGDCFVCGAEASSCYGRLTRQFHWSLPICRRHSEGPEKVPFPKDSPPPELITPDVQHWLDRHRRSA
jgi:hypothetical protein